MIVHVLRRATCPRWFLPFLLIALLASPASPFVASVDAQDQPKAAESTAPAQSGPPPASRPDQPRLVFSEDFEAYGDSSRWSGDHPFTVQRELVANGYFAARLTNDGDTPMYGTRHLNRDYARLYVRLRFQAVEIGAEPVTLLQLRPDHAGSVVSLRVNRGGEISWVTGATDVTSTSTPVVSTNAWHDVQLMVDTTTRKNNLRVWVDDHELTTMRRSVWLGEDAMGVFTLGDNRAGQHSDIAFDDIRIDEHFIDANRQADPVPGTLTVRAIPAWQGIEFDLDGQIFKTGDDGEVRIKVARWSTDLRSRIIVHDAVRHNEKISFSSWHSWKTPHSKDVYAMFQLWQPVTFSFVDGYGNPVDSSLIDTMVIKNSIGEIYTFDHDDLQGPVLLISSAVSTPEGMAVKPITYYIDQVTIDGANVVNRSQQRATLSSQVNWQVSLLFYTVTFQPRDALFGSPIGKAVTLRAPDGTAYSFPLDDGGNTAALRLPRGDYDIRVTGGGYSPRRPIRISRDQVIPLEVISRLDAALLGGTAAIAVIGLVVAGRPFLVTRPVGILARLAPLPRRAPDGGASS